ncbi:MAG: PIN domain-containing protein [Rhodobacteraceae bacterium]|jgi:hypothetical protein|nr:PIN domain-containing protein [Paracoccaceae bacterium]
MSGPAAAPVVAPAAVLDACVLYPTVLREILLGVAAAGLFAPVWSAEILEEWARAARRRLGPAEEALARAEIAAARAAFPAAEVPVRADAALAYGLPDPHDGHVVAAAEAARAAVIVTRNLADFPRRALAPLGLAAEHPDPFLLRLRQAGPGAVAGVAEGVAARAARLAGRPQPLRPLLKRAGLPRLARALER